MVAADDIHEPLQRGAQIERLQFDASQIGQEFANVRAKFVAVAVRRHGADAQHELVAERSMDPRIALEVVHDLAKKYDVREVAYDPNRFELAARMLDEDGFQIADAWGKRANQTRAWAAWYDGVTTQRLAHDGDLVLAEHVTHAEAEHAEAGWRVRKIRGQGRVKIDALVAAAMASWRCQMEGDRADYALSWDDIEVPA